jgi:hypothetical protein
MKPIFGLFVRKPMRKHLSASVLAIFASIALADSESIAGYYESRSNQDSTRQQLCIKHLQANTFETQLFTSYCPSGECLNARMDGIAFNSPLVNGMLSYESDTCSIRVRVSFEHAVVRQNGRCGEDFGLLVSDGKYKLLRPEVHQNDCSPLSND